jgi:hypothetical protein
VPQLICHLIGDYVLQCHLMANKKVQSWAWAVTHAAFYTLPFLFLTRSPWALLVIFGTHAAIDRYRLANYWMKFYGVGHPGIWQLAIDKLEENRVWSNTYTGTYDAEFDALPPGVFRDPKDKVPYSYHAACAADRAVDAVIEARKPFEAPPPYLGVWLGIIVDNTLHLTINYLAIAYADGLVRPAVAFMLRHL